MKTKNNFIKSYKNCKGTALTEYLLIVSAVLFSAIIVLPVFTDTLSIRLNSVLNQRIASNNSDALGGGSATTGTGQTAGLDPITASPKHDTNCSRFSSSCSAAGIEP